jgi:2,3,4,5-tetrahydropyridine-2,6-dicarboxylate N-succinyltransferase
MFEKEYELVNGIWEDGKNISSADQGNEKGDAVKAIIEGLGKGVIKSAEKIDGVWVTNDPAKKAIMLSFRLFDNEIMGAEGLNFWDKVPLKYGSWDAAQFKEAGFRAVPGALIRQGVHIGKDVILMNSFANIGASIGDNSMLDSFALAGSCCQIGKGCHVSAHVTLGGVLEPINATPVIVEDNCTIGAGSRVVEGAIIGECSTLAPNTVVSRSIPIIDREGDCMLDSHIIPPKSLVVPGSVLASKAGSDIQVFKGAAVILKRNISKGEINDLLRAGPSL